MAVLMVSRWSAKAGFSLLISGPGQAEITSFPIGWVNVALASDFHRLTIPGQLAGGLPELLENGAWSQERGVKDRFGARVGLFGR